MYMKYYTKNLKKRKITRKKNKKNKSKKRGGAWKWSHNIPEGLAPPDERHKMSEILTELCGQKPNKFIVFYVNGDQEKSSSELIDYHRYFPYLVSMFTANSKKGYQTCAGGIDFNSSEDLLKTTLRSNWSIGTLDSNLYTRTFNKGELHNDEIAFYFPEQKNIDPRLCSVGVWYTDPVILSSEDIQHIRSGDTRPSFIEKLELSRCIIESRPTMKLPVFDILSIINDRIMEIENDDPAYCYSFYIMFNYCRGKLRPINQFNINSKKGYLKHEEELGHNIFKDIENMDRMGQLRSPPRSWSRSDRSRSRSRSRSP